MGKRYVGERLVMWNPQLICRSAFCIWVSPASFAFISNRRRGTLLSVMTEIIAEGAGELGENIWSSYSTRDRTLLSIGSIASFAMFWTVGGMFSTPRFYGYDASLLMQPSPVVILLMTAVLLVACVLITSFFTHIVHFEGGLFCAAIGMLALSVRGGAMHDVLMDAPDSGVFLKLMLELLLLFAIVAVGWFALMTLRDLRLIRGEPHGDADPDDMPFQGVMALATQVVVMLVLMLLLAQTDKKAQAVWAVAISAYGAALAAHSLFPSRPSIWYWITPLIVGVIGYALAWSGGTNLPGGEVGGWAPALGRPLPLDYASVGVAGSIYGYWTSRRWEHERNEEPEAPEQVEDALEHPVQNA